MHVSSGCVVFRMHKYSFAGLIRQRPPPTFGDTAITNRHSDTTFSAQSTLGADILVYWTGKIVRTCAADGSQILDFLRKRRTPYPLGQTFRFNIEYNIVRKMPFGTDKDRSKWWNDLNFKWPSLRDFYNN